MLDRGLYLSLPRLDTRRFRASDEADPSQEALCFLTLARRKGPFLPDSDRTIYTGHGIYFDAVSQRWSRVDRTFFSAMQDCEHIRLWSFEGEDGYPQPYHDDYLDRLDRVIGDWLVGFTHDKCGAFFAEGAQHDESSPAGDSPAASGVDCAGAVMRILRRGFKALGVALRESELHGQRWSWQAAKDHWLRWGGPHSGQLPFGPDFTARFDASDIEDYADALCELGNMLGRFDGMVHGGFDVVRTPNHKNANRAPYDLWKTWRLNAPRRTTDSLNQAKLAHVRQHVLAHHLKGPRDDKVGGKGVWSVARSQGDAWRGTLASPNQGYVYVTEYGFRADLRSPIQIAAAGGMFPNALREDRQELLALKGQRRAAKLQTHLPSAQRARGVIQKETLNNFVHQSSAGSDYSGFVSVSRSGATACDFCGDQLAEADKSVLHGFVYVVRVHDAVDCNATFSDALFDNEAEISQLGGIRWQDVMGWRKINRYYVMPGSQGWAEGQWGDELFIRNDPGLLPPPHRAELVRVMSLKW